MKKKTKKKTQEESGTQEISKSGFQIFYFRWSFPPKGIHGGFRI
jgi:hypothetical protein